MIHTIAKTYNWTISYILSLPENILSMLMVEIRKEQLDKQIEDMLQYGKEGIKKIYELPADNPVKIRYLRHKKNEVKSYTNQTTKQEKQSIVELSYLIAQKIRKQVGRKWKKI